MKIINPYKGMRKRNYDREITFNDKWGGILSKDLVRTPIICNFTFRITLKVAIFGDKKLIKMDLGYFEDYIRSEIRTYYAVRNSDVIDNEKSDDELYHELCQRIKYYVVQSNTYVTIINFNVVSIKKKKQIERRNKLNKINNINK